MLLLFPYVKSKYFTEVFLLRHFRWLHI